MTTDFLLSLSEKDNAILYHLSNNKNFKVVSGRKDVFLLAKWVKKMVAQIQK